jgi:23S rRNA pseudouridine2605 synthase
MRLQKFLARAGVASRRAGERLIAKGRVRVDGATVVEQGVQVDPENSVVEVDGRRVQIRPARWLVLNKPPGYICSRLDPQGRPTVYDLLPDDAAELFHVGRLDFLSEGLMLFTNEGEVAQALLHPSRGTPRRYRVTVARPVADDLPERLLTGVELEDGVARAETARLGSGRRRTEMILELTLREGRKREIRRMLGALDVRIHKLQRTEFGPLALGELPSGVWRELTPEEIEHLRALSER